MNPFESKTPTTEQVEMMERVRKACAELHTLIGEIPLGRFNLTQSQNASDKLEEACMWANKAIVFANADECEDCNCDGFKSMPGSVNGFMVVEPADGG